MTTTSRNLTLAWVTAVALTATAPAAEKKEFRYTVAPGATVTVVNDSGMVRVRAAGAGQVLASAIASSPKVEVDAAQYGNRVELRTHFLQKAGEAEGRVEYEVQVPADANVMVRTASAPVVVQGVSGNLLVDTDMGRVEVRDSSGHVNVRTVGGAIMLTNLKDGFVEATSVGGQVTLNGVAGKLVSVSTTAGAISYNGDFGGGGQYALSSHAGNVDISLPASASVDVNARTVTGTVENDFPLHAPTHLAAALEQGKSFAGTSNAGASAVRLRTFSGKIRVKKSN